MRGSRVRCWGAGSGPLPSQKHISRHALKTVVQYILFCPSQFGRAGGGIGASRGVFVLALLELPVPLRWYRCSCSTPSGLTGNVGVFGFRVSGAEGSAGTSDQVMEVGAGALSDERAWETVSEAAVCILDRMARALRRL